MSRTIPPEGELTFLGRHHVIPGETIHLTWPDPSDITTLRPSTRWERVRFAARDLWLRLTWWRYARLVAVEVTPETIVYATERWSWRKWRWVRITAS